MIDGLMFAEGATGFATGVFVTSYWLGVRKRRSGKMRLGGLSSSHFTAHGKTGELDYGKIAWLEIETYGETQQNEGSPYRPGLKTLGVRAVKSDPAYQIDSSGHYFDRGVRRCNVNCQMGPVCEMGGNHAPIPKKILTDTRITHRPYRPELPPDPYADWTDEDGRPW